MIMEEKINLAKILNGKPVNTKLYSPLYGDVYFSYIGVRNNICVQHHRFTLSDFFYNGRYTAYKESEIMLFPSKEMRDWSKFAWKKGDVLVSKDNVHIIFEKFENDAYTRFKGKHYLWKYCDKEDYNKEETKMLTSVFEKANDDVAQTYIKTIEEKLGGKLNGETLEVEKAQQEFKDGDILSNPSTALPKNHIFIFSKFDKHKDFEHHVALTASGVITIPTSHGIWCRKDCGVKYATEEEKKQLFSALEKEGKAWDAEKKEVVDIKKELQFKPFEKVLVRDSYDDMWRASFFSHIKEDDGRYVTTCFTCKFCIPYEGNEHLLGTTDNFE